MFAPLRRALATASNVAFRIIHFSVQRDHVHLIVEADDATAFVRGLQGLSIRCARAVNRVTGARGKIWPDRYHAHPLRTPTEVRRGIAYVLLNFKKHLHASTGVDPRSSGPWFEGWRQPLPTKPTRPTPVAAPATWLASVGWRRVGGALDLDAPVATPSA